MGAAKKHVSYDTYPDSDEHKNRAANIMLSTNSKRMVAKKQNERVLRRKFEKKKPRLTLFRALVIAFVLGILCVGQYGIIQDMGLKINESQQTLDDINATNEALKQQSRCAGQPQCCAGKSAGAAWHAGSRKCHRLHADKSTGYPVCQRAIRS